MQIKRKGKKFFKDFEIKSLGEYLYVQSDILLLADVFENFRNMCPKIYEFDVARFFFFFFFFSFSFPAPGLAWQVALKNTKIKLDLLTDINMLLMTEKGICLQGIGNRNKRRNM